MKSLIFKLMNTSIEVRHASSVETKPRKRLVFAFACPEARRRGGGGGQEEEEEEDEENEESE